MAAFVVTVPLLGVDLAALLPARWSHGDGAGRRHRSRSRKRSAATLGAVERDSAPQRSDESLMLDFLDGRREAFETLVTRYQTELHQFLARFLNSATAADDVFQEAFLQVYQSGHTFDAARRFKPWLYTIAANKARDWHRRHRNRGALSLDAPLGSDAASISLVDLLAGDAAPPDSPMEREEEAMLVKRVVDEMPVNLREILLLAYFQRLSYGQIADALQIPLGTVKSRLHSAVAAFAALWRDRMERRGDESNETDASNPHGPDA